MKCYCNDYPFLILEFSIINLKYEQFKWISVPSEGESSTGPNAQKLFAHIQTWKNFQQGRAFPMLWCIVLMRVPLRLKFAIEYAVGNPILAFITTWLSKWVVLRRKILSKVSSRKNHGTVVNFFTSHGQYYYAFQYVMKEDQEYVKSANHPPLDDMSSLQTKKCISEIRKRAAMRKSGSEASATNNNNNVPWLGKFEVSQFILHENVKDQTTSAA